MVKGSKDYGASLLQNNPAREMLLEKMRSKLATTPPPALEQALRRRVSRRTSLFSWGWKAGLALVFVAANYLLISHKDVIISRIGLESVPALPKPEKKMDVDEQALYWTYALYDIRKFRQHFGVQGYYAINSKDARKQLEALLPQVGPATLGMISAYGPIVAFKSVQPSQDVRVEK
ncbi:MAG: hypothetical protein JWO30_4555 [Fibrobacteres bacterium]|nr:hypothetical protein [Fibrobacterota bacterium]